MVDDQQAAPAGAGGRRRQAAGHRVGELAPVLDLADQLVAGTPDPDHAAGTRMGEAVGGQLRDRDLQVGDPVAGEPHQPALGGDQLPQGGQRLGVLELPRDHRTVRYGQRPVVAGDDVQRRVLRAGPARAALDEDRVGGVRVGQYPRGEPARVVRAQDGRRAPGERGVDQRLMLRAGRVLVGGAPGPDRFADDVRVPAGVLGDEGVQYPRDDPAGVATGPRHVGEAHPGGVRPERGADPFEVRPGYGHQNRLASGQRPGDERYGAGEVIVVVMVEEPFVDEGVVGGGHLDRRTHELSTTRSTTTSPPTSASSLTISGRQPVSRSPTGSVRQRIRWPSRCPAATNLVTMSRRASSSSNPQHTWSPRRNWSTGVVGAKGFPSWRPRYDDGPVSAGRAGSWSLLEGAYYSRDRYLSGGTPPSARSRRLIPVPTDTPDAPRWRTYSERTLYDNPWVRLVQVDLEPPDGH